jgi:hypothetical protein
MVALSTTGSEAAVQLADCAAKQAAKVKAALRIMMHHDGTEGRTMKHDLSLTRTESVRAPEFKAPAAAPVSDVDPFSIEFFEGKHFR